MKETQIYPTLKCPPETSFLWALLINNIITQGVTRRGSRARRRMAGYALVLRKN